MEKYSECQKPFSPCWCESRPNNPHCKDVISVSIDSSILVGLLISTIIIVAFLKIKNLK